MTIDSVTGLVQWTPLVGQTGTHVVTVRVQDPLGLIDTQSYTLTVSPAVGNQPPIVNAAPTRRITLPSVATLVGGAATTGCRQGVCCRPPGRS